jgi:glycosyltransferase involved in cell wall biosynthesis
MWRLADLSESTGQTIDLLVATKFPSYFARHPRKVTWLVHQHRAAYELVDTPYSDFGHREFDVALRDRILALDNQMLGECRASVHDFRQHLPPAEAVQRLESTPLYHPPRLAARLKTGEAGNYVLHVGRLESVKRVDLAIRAMQHVSPSLSLWVAGTGTNAATLHALADSLGLSSRVRFLGEVSNDELIDLYAGALAVVFPPFDEDYGVRDA